MGNDPNSLNGSSFVRRAASRVRSGITRKAFGRDLAAEVTGLQGAMGAINVAISEAIRDLGQDILEGLRAENLRRTDQLLERLDRKMEGLFAELTTRGDLGTFLTGEGYRQFREQVGSRALDPGDAARYAEMFRTGPEGAVVVLGCGRGELVTALTGADLEAYGVDTSPALVDEARAAGLTVHLEDSVEHLGRLEEGAIAGAVGIGIVEHLAPGAVERLCVEAARALVPGGLLVLETPNPASLPAYLNRLVKDPGHTWAAHHEALRYIAVKSGLEIVDVQFLHPVEDAPPVEAASAGQVHELLYGPQDYALIACRPGT